MKDKSFCIANWKMYLNNIESINKFLEEKRCWHMKMIGKNCIPYQEYLNKISM